ncbi:MAG: hypothetical protein DBY09_00955 [Selenomonadales bacterium]|nr:MAG: hypothetical protein DBY09_00955 [Selenomonadales bacterium]
MGSGVFWVYPPEICPRAIKQRLNITRGRRQTPRRRAQPRRRGGWALNIWAPKTKITGNNIIE